MTTTKVNLANTVEGILPVANGGTGTSTGVAPGGSTTQVQYNNAGAFGGSANLTFNGTTLTAAALTSTGVATFSAGTVSAPAITTSGDTNTGIFFPAADTIAFTEGGVESMRIDSSGNVGIGTSSPGDRIHAAASVAAGLSLQATGTGGSTWRLLSTDNVASIGGGYLGFNNGSYRMVIDSSGNVGIGTSSPGGKLHVSGGRSLFIGGNENYSVGIGRDSNTNSYYLGVHSTSSPDLLFSNNAGTERMRLTDGGDLRFNSGYGSVATAYGTRLWVNFNGSNGSVRGSAGISSVSRTGTGAYTVNYSITLPDTNYSATCGGGDFAGGDNICTGILSTGGMGTTSIQLVAGLTGGSGGRRDVGVVCLIVTR